MKKQILIAAIVGLIVGLVAGLLLNTVPFLDNLVPDNFKSLITGGLAGGLAVVALGIGKNTNSE